MKWKTALVVACTLTMVAAFGGCNRRPKTIPVSGVVTYKGQPVKNAAVLFAGSSRPASGTTDAEGRFQLMTFDPGDEALPGEYRVAVDASELVGRESETAPATREKVKWNAPEKYSRLDSSGLTATVASGQPELRFDLK